MNETADILIIGGGIAGAGAAARLSPDARIIVLEMEDALGRHATGRSAAIYIRNYGNATLRALNVASEPVLKEPDGIAEETLLSPRGEMLIASEEELDAFNAYLKGADGMERLDADGAVALFPLLKRERIAAAAIERDAQDIDVDRLLQGFARLARRNGARFITDAPAERLARRGGVWRVETPQGTFEAPIVVNAAGAWADVIADRAGARRIGLVPMRRSAAILPAPAGIDVSGWPLVASASEGWYAKPDAGKLMVSPADEDPVEPHDAWPDDMVLAEGLHRFEQAVTMPVTRVERSWAGLRSFVSDRTPAVGFAPDADGFFWLAGQGGYGVQTAPALSRLAADLCLKRPSKLPPDIVKALDPARLF
ncbi:D-arginine dehydrogenase [Breoghania corrubedonensis]|uniref:D-arginine dehydrogenase n=1 Tax=Breoghania corrubedonensis TaxID=665038 RepID=A0A2T5V5I0_9HYPH|nr:FAD-dependent oxidoreductase [Breoghania corrubedonensis]PTW59012.1 D-arginine dehydrogenase [Breoghania corrubedonensis]